MVEVRRDGLVSKLARENVKIRQDLGKFAQKIDPKTVSPKMLSCLRDSDRLLSTTNPL